MERTTMTAELTAGASFDSDWHVYIDTPDRGPLGYCLGQDDEFDPEAATLHLAAEGWRVVGEWTLAPDDEPNYQYIATVTPTRATPAGAAS